jgi:hypothetical protein
MRWKTTARTAARRCRKAWCWATASPARTTASRCATTASSPACPAAPVASWKARRPRAASTCRSARRRVPVQRDRVGRHSAAAGAARAADRRRPVRQLPLLHRVEGRLPLRARQRDGPDARHLPAQAVALDGRGRHRRPSSIRATDHRLRVREEGQRDVNFDWTEWADTGIHWMRLEIPYPKTGGPGGNFIIIGSYTPIANGMTAGVFWRCRKLEGLAARHLALPVPQPAGSAPLARAGAGPRDARGDGARRQPAREPVPARHGHRAPAPPHEAGWHKRSWPKAGKPPRPDEKRAATMSWPTLERASCTPCATGRRHRERRVPVPATAAVDFPAFEAGSHIDLHLPNGMVRSYSL